MFIYCYNALCFINSWLFLVFFVKSIIFMFFLKMCERWHNETWIALIVFTYLCNFSFVTNLYCTLHKSSWYILRVAFFRVLIFFVKYKLRREILIFRITLCMYFTYNQSILNIHINVYRFNSSYDVTFF